MKVIGLTGGSGSGKSVISALLQKNGAYIIDADKIAHDIILRDTQAYVEIVAYFGEKILDQNREINRKALGNIVFQYPKKREFLNSCTHKYIRLEIEKQIETIKKQPKIYSFIVLDVPLLIESGLIPICDMVLVVYAKIEDRIKRIMLRDNITYEQARDRISSQMPWEQYCKVADMIIDNSNDLTDLEAQVCEIVNKLKIKGE